MFFTLEHFIQLLNHFCGTCCGVLFFSLCGHQFCYTLIKKDKLELSIIRNWPHLNYIQPKKPMPESAHIPFFLYRIYFTD